MRLEIIPKKEGLQLKGEYKREEWEKLESFYTSSSHYERRRITRLFGKNIAVDAYALRDDSPLLSLLLENTPVEHELRKKLDVPFEIIDDINKPPLFLSNDTLYFNISLFRIIPSLHGDVYMIELLLPNDVIYDFDLLPLFTIIIKHIVKVVGIYSSKYRVRCEIIVEEVRG